MNDILEFFQYAAAPRALIASMLVGLMCGVLGCFIVLRNMSLIGDALAHAILPGVVLAFVLIGYSALGFFTGSVLAGLLAALGITWIQQNVKTKNDAAIGIVFTAMFSIGIMGISWISKNEGVHLDLKDFLFGNVLGVANQDLYLTAGVTVYVLLSVIVFYRYLLITTFQPIVAETMGISVKMMHYFLMLLLSFAVVASLQTVGVILVVAMLITPASTALLFSNQLKWVLVLSGGIGLLASFLGLLMAVALDTTPGPAMAVVATILYLVAVFFAPNKGLFLKWLRNRKLRYRIQQEDILKQSFRLQEENQLSEAKLLERLGFKNYFLQKGLKKLRRQGWIAADRLALTDQGATEARRLVRAHRLWETYLADKMGLDAAKVHDEAERYEHLLPEHLLDEVDESLGYPTFDPHGEPIPTKNGLPAFPLSRLNVLQEATIAAQQVNEHVEAQLWQMGLTPESIFTIQRKDAHQVEIQINDKKIGLPLELARQINVLPPLNFNG